MKHLNKLRVALCTAAVVVAVAFFACSKEQTAESTLPTDRRVLAVKDVSGNIVNSMTPEEVTALVNSKVRSTQYVIESYAITEPDETIPYHGLIVSLIEVETGEAVSFALYGDYVEEIESHFYLSSEAARGNIEFSTPDGYVGKLVNFVDQPLDPSYAPPGGCGIFVTCRQKNCKDNNCRPRWMNCTPCEPNVENKETECYVSGQGWGWWFLELVLRAWALK